MIFATLIGVILGVNKIEITAALGVLAISLIAKAVFDIKWDKVPLLGLVSPYVVYCHNLSQAGESTHQAWISYALQLIVFGMLLGAASYGTVRFFI